MDALRRLREVVGSEGGPLAETLWGEHAQAPAGDVFARLVAAGDRARQAPERYALLVESILEGYLVHHGRGRIVKPVDQDLCLLAGDYLYALGLEVVAQLGDLEAVGELADLISLCAEVHVRPDNGGVTAPAPWAVTEALWGLAVLAVGCGGWPEQRRAKEAVRLGAGVDPESLLETVWRRGRAAGLALELEQALIAFRGNVAREPSTI